MKIALIAGVIGHSLCAITDYMMTYTPHGKFSFSDCDDHERMSGLFENMPQSRIIQAIVLGVLALCVASFGYAYLTDWVNRSNEVVGRIMAYSSKAFIVFITAHHVCCGAAEWFFVQSDRSTHALTAVKDFFKKTSILMIVGYLALLVFSVALLITVFKGETHLPIWAAVFNTLPLYLLLLLTKLPAKGNIAGAIMFLGLLFVL